MTGSTMMDQLGLNFTAKVTSGKVSVFVFIKIYKKNYHYFTNANEGPFCAYLDRLPTSGQPPIYTCIFCVFL